MRIDRRHMIKLLSSAAMAACPAQAQPILPRSKSIPVASPPRCVYEGYLDRVSYGCGDSLTFSLNVNKNGSLTDLRIGIFRIANDAPNNEEQVALINRAPGRWLPYEVRNPITGLIECDWPAAEAFRIPNTWRSGLYVARFCRNGKPLSSEVASPIPFVIRDLTAESDIVVQTSDQIWQAYNLWGGANFYDHCKVLHRFGIPEGPELPFSRALQISHHRPYLGEVHFFDQEKALALWLEKHGYNAEFWSSEDIAKEPVIRQIGSREIRPKLLISAGHDEYWTIEQRMNFEEARKQGVGLLFLSGDTCFWQVQREFKDSPQVMTCFKEPWRGANVKDFFLLPEVQAVHQGKWSGAWRDDRRKWASSENLKAACGALNVSERLEPSVNWGEWSLTGLGWRHLSEGAPEFADQAIQVNIEESKKWIWKDTLLSNSGGRLAPGILSHEVDGPFGGNWGSPSKLITYSTTDFKGPASKRLFWTAHRIDNGATDQCYNKLAKDNPDQATDTDEQVRHHIVSFMTGETMTISVGTTKWCQFLISCPVVSQVTKNFLYAFGV